MESALAFLAQYGLLILVVVMFADQIGVPVPPEPFLLGAGALMVEGRMSPVLGTTLALGAALAANAIWYFLGVAKGPRILKTLCRFSLEADSCVRRMEGFFAKHGAKSLLVAKFIPGLNTITPAMAGVVRLDPARFFAFNAIGLALWIGAWGFLGVLFHRQLETAAAYASRLGSVSLGIVMAVFALFLAWKFLHRRRILRELRLARMTLDELKKSLDAGEPVVIIDARGEPGIVVDPRGIPGAIRMAPEEIESRHEEIPRDREIVVYCT
jgi:membrane protein DedA with SNARE-associated domain